MIEIRHLRKEYEACTPLEDVSLTVRDGDVISVIGPSGTGKSTLIRCLNLLEKPTSGEIFIDGECITDPKCDVSRIRKKMGMVFQSFNLFGHLTVLENVMKPRIDLLGADRQSAYDKAMELLHTVGLDGRAMQYPDMLSGGQKQRVAIARALSTDPQVILFDEPTSALDPTMVGEVQSVIGNLAETGRTMIIVTHEMKFARRVANRAIFMAEGGIYEDGTPEQVFAHPRKELTRRFIRQLKVFEKPADENGTDLPAILGGMVQFCLENKIPDPLPDKMQEATKLLLSQFLQAQSRVTALVEYDEVRLTAYVKFRWHGTEPLPPEWQTRLEPYCSQIDFAPTEDGNEIALHVK